MDQVGLAAPEFGLQKLPEQVVVAVPLAAAVERDHQQVPGFHLLENSAGSLLTQDRVAQRSAHPVQDRRADEERRFRFRDPVEEFRAQVVAHIDVVACEREADIALPGSGLNGQRGDIEADWPAFSALQKITQARLVGVDPRALQQ